MATLMMVAGTALAGYGTYQQGVAAKAEGEGMAAVAEYNAKVAEMQGKEEQRRLNYQAELKADEMRRIRSEQTAAYGKSGVQFLGSPLSVIEETQKELEMDRLMLLREGVIAEQMGRSAAVGKRAEADMYKRVGRNKYRGSKLSAGGTILTGFSQVI